MGGKWPFTIQSEGGTDMAGYAIDPLHDQFSGPNSVALMRAQADTSERPNEGSLNREDFWRRTMTSWHHGAGQKVNDDDDSDPFRYHASRGVNPWERGELSLLATTAPITSAVEFNPTKMITVQDVDGEWLYYIDGTNAIRQFLVGTFASDLTLPTTAEEFTVVDAAEVTQWWDIATDGYYVYAAASGQGIWRFLGTDETIGPEFNTLPAEQLWFVRNRLIAGYGAAIYNVISDVVPDALYTHPIPDWHWNGAAEAGSYIYLSGRAGRASAIYKTTVGENDTAELDPPIIATQLPDGETVLAIHGYAGFILIGTTMGVRLAQPDGQGFLTYGSLLGLGAVSAFEGEGNFVWAGSFDQSTEVAATHLWRLNLQEFIAPLTPAYAMDLEGTTSQVKSRWTNSYVSSIVTYGGKKMWCQATDQGVLATGISYIHVEQDDLVAEGWLSTGRITYGMTEEKRAVSFVVKHRPLPGPGSPVAAQLSLIGAYDYADAGEFDFAATLVESSTATTFRPHTEAEQIIAMSFSDIELTLYLRREGADGAVSPHVTSVTVKARPTPDRAYTYLIPVIINDEIEDLREYKYKRDATAMMEKLIGYAGSGERLEMALLGHSFLGYVEDFQNENHQISRFDRFFRGTLLLRIREVTGA